MVLLELNSSPMGLTQPQVLDLTGQNAFLKYILEESNEHESSVHLQCHSVCQNKLASLLTLTRRR